MKEDADQTIVFLRCHMKARRIIAEYDGRFFVVAKIG